MNNVTATMSDVELTRFKRVFKNVRSAGLAIPADLSSAFEYADQRAGYNGHKDAYQKLLSASPKDYNKYANEYAAAYTAGLLFSSNVHFQADLAAAQAAKLKTALYAAEEGLFDQLVTAFNSNAEAFHGPASVLYGVRDSAFDKVSSFTGDQLTALIEARGAVEPLASVYETYTGLAKALGYIERDGDKTHAGQHQDEARRLGAENHAQASAAGELIKLGALGVDAARGIRDLLPFIALPLAGAPLHLHHPLSV